MPVPDDPRRQELARNLAAVRERVAAACERAGRRPDAVCLIVVTKTFPAADVLRLASLGVTDVGENRDQEAAAKAGEVARAVRAAGAAVLAPRWHFVGHLQRNKCRSVVRYADMVHSVDSVRLAQALDKAVRTSDSIEPARGRLDVLVQVSLDGEPARGGAIVGGAHPDTALDHVVTAVAGAPGLRLRGLMAVAPLGADPDCAFGELERIAETVRRQHPAATVLSAGMSGDFEQAIRYGATHVRVGSAVLGERPPGR